ncbi:sua5 [Symbiodinium natans]|uniref:Threonylcarbamoyl-AMP synthase n=1 Tax=Symbiodinium natans TaxID=878477 RepID=A0A812N099_9DINO|nr:sua5 [Symbiodinium natans]
MARKRPASAVETEDQAACILRPPHDAERLAALGAALRRGRLVSFPTETVYGLGANGLDPDAVLQIFEAKGRPLTDPCILHVAKAADALPLLDLDSLPGGRALFDVLTKEFWPGPLSIVGPARAVVPPQVTASTGFVAVRCPSHPLARQLVEAAGKPLAAPSANRFGHISPTLPDHVLQDLQHVPFLQIIDGGPCNVGIESTVVKLDLAGTPKSLQLLRQGGLPRERLESYLTECFQRGELQESIPVVSIARNPRSGPVVKPDDEAQMAPGMLLKHYAPSVHTVLLSPDASPACESEMSMLPSRSLLIDFGGRQSDRHALFLKVYDLCEENGTAGKGTAEDACRHVFATLRAAEAYAIAEKVELICVADFDPEGLGGYAEALHDRCRYGMYAWYSGLMLGQVVSIRFGATTPFDSGQFVAAKDEQSHLLSERQFGRAAFFCQERLKFLMSRGDLATWLLEHTLPGLTFDQVMDNFCGTVAAGCVVSYVLGLGDRHLENICLTKQGEFFHIDFGYFLGEDPKPFAPQVRLPAQVAQALLATNRLHLLYTLARRAYLALRPFGTLFAGLLNLEVENGQRYGRLAKDSETAIAGMLERLRIDQEDEERAAAEFLALVQSPEYAAKCESCKVLRVCSQVRIEAAGQRGSRKPVLPAQSAMPATDASDARALAAAPLVPVQRVRWRSNATLQRVLGLTLKASLLSADRFFDLFSLWKILRTSSTWLDVVQQTSFWLLCFGALASTVLSALTLSRHRAAIRQNRPYGWGLALFISAIQLAPLVEMVDKIGDGFCWGVGEEDVLSSVASVISSSPHDGPTAAAALARRSRRQAMAEMKGSRYGENLMRGLRKLTIASLPLILLSAIVHSAWLREIAQAPHAWDGNYTAEASALAVGIICLAMACADVVLYVWVDDAFVRTHKKLVQIHYFIEILTRLPLCLLLHCVHFDKCNPLLFLWMGDVTTSVLLLLMPTLWGWTRRRLSCRHAWSQVASAVIMSQILFFVNITVFDPREAFQFVNAGFYIVKYMEAFIICKMLQWHGGFQSGFLQRLSEFELAAVLLSAAVVWVVVPKLRALQDATSSSEAIPRLSRLLPTGEVPGDLEAGRRSRSQLFGIPQGLSLELGTVGSPQSSSALVARLRGGQAPRPATQRLDLLGDMLEGLCLLSQSQSSRNRPAVARSTVVDVLWSLVLPWDGEYDDGRGGVVKLETLDVEKGAVLIKRQKPTDGEEGSASSMASERETEALGVIFQGTVLEVVLSQQEGRKLGSFTGKQILFADELGTVWTRRKCKGREGRECENGSTAPAAAREVLRLVLTQLLLSLRWEPTHLGIGPSSASTGALVAIDASQRPLLSFLLRYATGTQDLTLLSEIYWSLWCLSEDSLDAERITYDKARWVLIKSLAGTIEFWDGARGTRLDNMCPDVDRIVSFRSAALRLLTQQASLWQQTLSLADLGAQTVGETAEKTRAVRSRLLELKKAAEDLGTALFSEARHQEYLPEDAYMEEVLEAGLV